VVHFFNTLHLPFFYIVMGLGKTVQTIAFLAWLHAKNGSEKDADGKDEVVDICDSDDEVDTSTKTKNKPVHVVVVPASVLDNWMDEFEKFAPQLSVVK
jgi:SNF2 family DNA or RNA helicase